MSDVQQRAASGRVRQVVHQFCPCCHKSSDGSPYGVVCSLECLDALEAAPGEVTYKDRLNIRRSP